MIYTYNGAKDSLVAEYLTWGRYCEAFLAYSDEEWTAPGGMFTTIKLRHGSGKTNIWETVVKMHRDVSDRLHAGTIDFDFMIVGGDDMFWVPENLIRWVLVRCTT